MRPEHKLVSFDPFCAVLVKTTITFSTDLELRQFKRNLKANTLNYLPPKTIIFQLVNHYQFNRELCPISLKFPTSLFWLFPPFFTQILNLIHSLKACKQALVHPNIIQNHHTQIHFIIISNKDHFSIKYTHKSILMLV